MKLTSCLHPCQYQLSLGLLHDRVIWYGLPCSCEFHANENFYPFPPFGLSLTPLQTGLVLAALFITTKANCLSFLWHSLGSYAHLPQIRLFQFLSRSPQGWPFPFKFLTMFASVPPKVALFSQVFFGSFLESPVFVIYCWISSYTHTLNLRLYRWYICSLIFKWIIWAGLSWDSSFL